jgi:hypothetical protein
MLAGEFYRRTPRIPMVKGFILYIIFYLAETYDAAEPCRAEYPYVGR